MRILLVDDETSVLQALVAVLRTLPGHDVRVATNVDKALENAGAMGGVDLLVTDVVMEPVNGFTLRNQIASLYPHARTIFISGYDLSDYPEQLQDHQFLAKPVEAHALLEAVRQELTVLAASAPKPVASPPQRAFGAAAVKPLVAARPMARGAGAGIAQPRAVPAGGSGPRIAGVPQVRAVVPGVVPRAVAPVVAASAAMARGGGPSFRSSAPK
jgi:CheY-like chemotaxis protein